MKYNPFSLSWIAGTLTVLILTLIHDPNSLLLYSNYDSMLLSALFFLITVAVIIFLGFIVGFAFILIDHFLAEEKYADSVKSGNLWTAIIAALFVAGTIIILYIS